MFQGIDIYGVVEKMVGVVVGFFGFVYGQVGVVQEYGGFEFVFRIDGDVDVWGSDQVLFIYFEGGGKGGLDFFGYYIDVVVVGKVGNDNEEFVVVQVGYCIFVVY